MDIEELREAVEASGRGPGRRFAAELRADLVRASHALWMSGEPLADIADALGIHVATVTRYLDEEVDLTEEASDLCLPSGLVPIAITQSAVATTTALRVTTPDGFVLDGLDVEDAATLIRALR